MTLHSEAHGQPMNRSTRTRKQATLYIPGEACPNAVNFDEAYKKKRSIGAKKMHERLRKERSNKERQLDKLDKLKREVRELNRTRLQRNEEIVKRELGLENIQQNNPSKQINNEDKNKCLAHIGHSIEKVISLCLPHIDNSLKTQLLLESIIKDIFSNSLERNKMQPNINYKSPLEISCFKKERLSRLLYYTDRSYAGVKFDFHEAA